MAVEITMPQLSDTMSQGTILNWLKKEGDKVKRGDALAEVETDKANLEIEAFHEGVLQKIIVPVGKSVEIGTVIAIIGKEGEVAAPSDRGPAAEPLPQDVPASFDAAKPHQAPDSAKAPIVAPEVEYRELTMGSNAAVPGAARGQDFQPQDTRVKASPLARNIAQAHNVELRELSGSGEGGRIVRRDVERALAGLSSSTGSSETASSSPVAGPRQPMPATTSSAIPSRPQLGAGVQPLSKMRATIAQRMVESITTIPHFYTTTRVVVDNLKKVRATLKSLPQYEGITYNHFIIKAVALALTKVPRINCVYSNEGIIQPSAVNVGIVTAVPDGLLIPVLQNAHELSLGDIVNEAKGLVHRARSGKPKPTDLVGGTFSVSNMGAYDVEQFSAIISPGQGAILAVSPIQDEPIVENGQVRVGATMRLTLSVDHRIIDGVMCGEFLTELKKLLEEPVLLLA